MNDFKVLYHPNKLLVRRNKIFSFDSLSCDRVSDLFKVMYSSGGIGLAAPQVGWNVKLFIMNVDGSELVFVNPKVVSEYGSDVAMLEGCLSFPGMVGEVVRKSNVIVDAVDLNGNNFTLNCDGLKARCVLHEFDHLNGKLLVHRTSKLYKGSDLF